MNNFLIVIGLIALLAGVGVFLMFGPHSDNEAPGGNQNLRVLVDNGKITPKQIDVSSKWPAILIFHNLSNQKHDLVIKKLDDQGKETEEIRHFEIDASDSLNVRLQLAPGEYVVYCTIRQGEHSHRADGEEAKIIVQ